MRVVLDTNVVVSGILWGGTPLRVLELWAGNRLEVFASPEIFDEYRRILTRKRNGHAAPELKRWVEFMHARIRLIHPVRRVALCRDPDDDKFLECALAARVDCLVSGDGDLLALGDVEGIPVLGPGALLRIHGERLGREV